MKKTLAAIGVGGLVVLGVLVSIPEGRHEALAAITVCDSGDSLSYNQVKDALVSGEVVFNRNVDLDSNRVTITVSNNTPCSVPVSVGSYKMFGPYSLSTQSEQEFFDGSPTVVVAPFTTETLSVNVPSCAAQYDVWYGDVLRTLVNDEPYNTLILGDQIRLGLYCEHPVVVVPSTPIVASLEADTTCAVPGTSVNFVAAATGDGINSKTLEKDSNADGSYGEVVSWGGGPGTHAFSSLEDADYSGIYSIKFMVNGNEVGRKDVTISTSCAPIEVTEIIPVVVPEVVVPVVVPEIVVPVVTPVVAVVTPEVVIPVAEVVVTSNGGGSTSSSGSKRRESVSIASVVSSPIVIAPSLPEAGFAPRRVSSRK